MKKTETKLAFAGESFKTWQETMKPRGAFETIWRADELYTCLKRSRPAPETAAIDKTDAEARKRRKAELWANLQAKRR